MQVNVEWIAYINMDPTLDVQKFQGQPPGMVLKPCKWLDKLPVN